MSGLWSRPARTVEPTLGAAYQRLIEERVGIRLSAQQVAGLGELLRALLDEDGRALTPDTLYASFLRGGEAALFDTFAARLTIGETHFFRVAPQIAALRDVVLPDLLARRAGERRLALWSAGCSSGAEPYTLAILLRELLGPTAGWDLRLLATDLSEPALDEARRASYRAWAFRETPEWVRQRYFDQEGEAWRLHDTIRRTVQFRRHNLIGEPAPVAGPVGGPFDLILCRNVTIYFAPEVGQQLYRRFAQALAPGGWLVLGPSDPAPRGGDLFESLYLPGVVLWRRPGPVTARLTAAPRPVFAPGAPGAARSTALLPTRQSARTIPSPRPSRPAVPPSGDSPEGIAPQLEAVRRLTRTGDRRAAHEHLDRLLIASPLASAAHRLRGLLALEEGELTTALESLRRATFLAAEDPLAQFGLGRAYRALGDETRARAAFCQARRLLAAWPAEARIPGDEGLSAAELRGVVEAQLALADERQSERD